MDTVEYTYTFGMSESELRARLETGDVGVLALANEGAAYAIPVAYDFDDGLYVRLTREDSSKKTRYLETTTEACFLLYGVESPNRSWSVIATGTLRRLAGDERAAFDEAAINERFHRLRIFDEDVESVDIDVYEFEIETITGRKTGG